MGKACCFFGHRKYPYAMHKTEIERIIRLLIQVHNVDQFYCGGRGNFDNICSDIVGELRKEYPNIKNTLVFSYIPQKDDCDLPQKYTDSVYFLEEWVPPRFAILKTNEKIVEKSVFMISGVLYTWGGAAKAQEYARKKGKTILSLFD